MKKTIDLKQKIIINPIVIEEHRRTGRTTSMLEGGLALSKKKFSTPIHRVYFVFHNYRMARTATQMFMELLQKDEKKFVLRKTAYTIVVDQTEFHFISMLADMNQFFGLGPDSIVLYDHVCLGLY